jgi:hypothetical protein
MSLELSIVTRSKERQMRTSISRLYAVANHLVGTSLSLSENILLFVAGHIFVELSSAFRFKSVNVLEQCENKLRREFTWRTY